MAPNSQTLRALFGFAAENPMNVIFWREFQRIHDGYASTKWYDEAVEARLREFATDYGLSIPGAA